MDRAHLYISFSFFNWKDLKEKDLKNNIKSNHFVFNMHNTFRDKLNSIEEFNLNKFNSTIINNQNDFLFYIGVEDDIKTLLKNNYEGKINSLLKRIFNDGIGLETKIVKTKIAKQKTTSLVSFLKIYQFQNNLIEQDNPDYYVYILFPIKYGDFH